ncbi:hypothetical protein GCM10009765_08290 [Fodinicola feengrottensis]|uniref:CAAX prenyl protease 2/Lysostaphin resistance protein A-like domain-containing protein n=1 Tax=Fodinicola feengrottensis TaxID=435914 RepID=A0ABP4RU69_9ACTN
MIATWLGAGTLLVLQPYVHLDPELLMLTQFGPTIGVLAAIGLLAKDSQQGTKNALVRAGVGAGIVVALFGVCAAALALAGQPLHLAIPEQFWLIAPLQLIGACGEELGWRTFLQRHLQTRFSMIVSAVIVGVLWSTWHIQYYAFGPAFFLSFVTMSVAVSLIMAVLVRGTSRRGSLLVAGVFHWLLNLGILILLNFEQGGLRNMLILAASSVVIAAVVVGGNRQVTR